MYSHPALIEFISVLVVGGLVLYVVHWLVTVYRAIYERFFALIVGVVLLLGTAIIFTLGHNNLEGAIFYKIHRELLATTIFLFCFVFIQFCSIIVWNGLLVRNGRPIFPKILVRFINFLIYLIALLLILQLIYNINVTQLVVASSVVALILGYATQSSLSNIFAGITLNIARNVEIGNWIEVEITSGEFIAGHVESLDWRCVTLKSYEETLVVIPNSVLAEKIFVNYSQPQPVSKQQFLLKIAYTVRPDEVISYLSNAMSENAKICQDKKTAAHLDSLEQDGAVYHIEFFSKNHVNYDIKDEIIRSVYYQSLRASHSSSPFITFTRISHPNNGLRIDKEKIVHLISSQSILNCLQPNELNELINTADFERFAANEVLLHQGVANTCLHIILEGSVTIEHQHGDGSKMTLEKLDNFAVIGEYSMLLDELPRQTVRCTKESLVMTIRREAFRNIILHRIELIDALKKVIEERQYENDHKIRTDQKKKELDQKNNAASILARLKAIFSME